MLQFEPKKGTRLFGLAVGKREAILRFAQWLTRTEAGAQTGSRNKSRPHTSRWPLRLLRNHGQLLQRPGVLCGAEEDLEATAVAAPSRRFHVVDRLLPPGATLR